MNQDVSSKVYPSRIEYDMAIKDFAHTNRVVSLSGAEPITGSAPQFKLFAVSGGVSRVYRMRRRQDSFAYKCWISRVHGIEQRYPALHAATTSYKLPYFLPFEYADDGILVNKITWPVFVTQWHNGDTLGNYIATHHEDHRRMNALAERLAVMFRDLKQHGIAHGDLHDGNILVFDRGAEVDLVLIDYDGMYVPQMGLVEDTRIALASYQHPARSVNRWLGPQVDYFAQLCMYLSVLAYAERPSLYQEKQDQRLLFTAEDFLPGASNQTGSVFDELQRTQGEVKRLTEWMLWCLGQKSLDALPSLTELLTDTSTGTWQPGLPGNVRPAATQAPSPVAPAPDAASQPRQPAHAVMRQTATPQPMPTMSFDDAIAILTGSGAAPAQAPVQITMNQEALRSSWQVEPLPVESGSVLAASPASQPVPAHNVKAPAGPTGNNGVSPAVFLTISIVVALLAMLVLMLFRG